MYTWQDCICLAQNFSVLPMLGHIPITEGNLEGENKGEGGADQDGSLCGR